MSIKIALAVSYTHLDVYKRQDVYIDIFFVDFYSRKQENEDVAADFGNCRICPVFCI